MAKKKTDQTKETGNAVIDGINKKYGAIIESGTKVLESLETYKVLSISPALDIALGGGLREGSCVIMTGDPKTGKEQPLSSIVYTPTGPVKMGSVEVGDQVCTPDGGWSRITEIFPQGVKQVYKVTFSDGSTARCGLEHLWKVRRNDNRIQEGWQVLSLQEILESGLKYSDRHKWKTPLTNPVSFSKRDQTVPAYILGCLIGDGGLTQGSPIISTADPEIHAKFWKFAQSLGLIVRHKGQYDYAITTGNIGGATNPLTKELRKLNLMGTNSHSKFIPESYKYGSIEQRFQLIKGLMDTDGYNDHGVTAEYSTVSHKLALDVQEVLQSLGYTAKIKQRVTKCEGKEFPSFRLNISGENVSNLFSLSRKVFDKKRSKPNLERSIVKVQKDGLEECQCIMIDHPDHLYLTDGFNVTHNTTTALYFAGKAQAQGKKVFYFNTEGRLTKENFRGIKGLDIDAIQIVQTTDKETTISAEKYLNALETLIKQEEELVVIIDSTSNMVPQDELDGEIRTGVRNALPRLLSMFFKRISGDVSRTKAILIFITHNIANTSGSRFAPNKMADCGNMIQFQAGTNMVITHRGKWEVPKESGNHVGQVANWIIKTSAAGGTPNSLAESWIRYGVGIDEAQEICHIATQFALISAKGAWYTIQCFIDNKNDPVIRKWLIDNNITTPFDGSDDKLEKHEKEQDEAIIKAFKFQGMDNLSTFITEQDVLQEFLIQQVKEILL